MRIRNSGRAHSNANKTPDTHTDAHNTFHFYADSAVWRRFVTRGQNDKSAVRKKQTTTRRLCQPTLGDGDGDDGGGATNRCRPIVHLAEMYAQCCPRSLRTRDFSWLSHRYYMNLRARRAVLKCPVDMALCCRACHFRTHPPRSL